MLNLQAAAGDSRSCGEPIFHTESSCISSSSLQRKIQEKKLLVLDLDETLVHTVVHSGPFVDETCDLSFTISDRTYCVKSRPYVHTFLERVSELFNLVIFTASSKVYADTVLDFLDPQRKFIVGRYYLDSVVFHVDGKVKDLTIFGVDLAKVILVDNRPTNFRWQKDNGIPITSWYSDQQDGELSTLLLFLERLASADDVRPIIAERFSHCSTEIYSSQDPTTREVVAHNKRAREAPSILVGKRRKTCAKRSCIIRKEEQELWGLVSIAPPSCISV